ncbi:hypothetical protein Hanom_Chr06g00511041 [Helianthus anomalus]
MSVSKLCNNLNICYGCVRKCVRKSNRFLIAVPKIWVISCYGFLEKPLVLFVHLLW